MSIDGLSTYKPEQKNKTPDIKIQMMTTDDLGNLQIFP